MFLRRIARPLFAVPFVYSGLQAVLKPNDHLTEAREVVDQVSHFAGIPELSEFQLEQLARAHGALTAGAAITMAAGLAPRASSLTLAALTAPLVVANQPFTLQKGVDRTERMHKFVHAVGRLGAALIVGFDYEGKPGVSWRVTHARALKDAEREARELRAEVAKARAQNARKRKHDDRGHFSGHRHHKHHGGIQVVADEARLKSDGKEISADLRKLTEEALRAAEKHADRLVKAGKF